MVYLAWITIQIPLGIIFIVAYRDKYNKTTSLGENIIALIVWPYAIVGQIIYKFFHWII